MAMGVVCLVVVGVEGRFGEGVAHCEADGGVFLWVGFFDDLYGIGRIYTLCL